MRETSGSPAGTRASAGALKRAAAAEGLDFPGFGPHSLRRANITWRQEVGGSSIETARSPATPTRAMTEEYTLVGLKRQDELTRRIQDKRAKAAKRSQGLQVVKRETAA